MRSGPALGAGQRDYCQCWRTRWVASPGHAGEVMPAQTRIFKLLILADSCENPSDVFSDTTGSAVPPHPTSAKEMQ